MTRPAGLGAYLVVTAAYWAFMLTDGALRMLALLHFHSLGFSPVQLAYLFVLYEVAGIATNLSAGWIAARFGLTTTLFAGLALQIAALAALTQLDPAWSLGASVVFVMCVQGLAGVAKDLTKMSSKSAVKLLAPEGSLFGWVAALTGSKNAIKGLGFALGAGLLALLGFNGALWAMAGALALILIGALGFMPAGLPRGKPGTKFREALAPDPRIKRLSLARMFLFGARDAWFVVGVPVFLADALAGVAGARGAFFAVGAFMAVWVIFYGAVQASAPRILRAKTHGEAAMSARAAPWAAMLAAIALGLAGAAAGLGASVAMTGILIAGLLVFGAVFAVNSALHSYLILAYAGAERVSMDVGYYYMSNAAGRLIGTLLSGISYQLGGLALCLGAAAAMAALSALAAKRLG